MQQSNETLAGRIAYLELTPFDALEFAAEPPDFLWLRGGFPDSVLAAQDAISMKWRQDFIRTYLERDIPRLWVLAFRQKRCADFGPCWPTTRVNF